MQKLFDLFKKSWLIILVVLVTIPTFYRMLRPGIYSMQDFHFFRLFEFDKCVKNLQIPCRWAPDAGLGYGEPLFNFYGQVSYGIGEIFHLLGFSLIDSIKILFILSLLGSALTMYFLAKKIWKNDFAAFVSAVLYLYAPYRAVEVWVRGALPEALSFVLFPLILLCIDKYIEKKNPRSLIFFSVLLAILISTHNLSFIMFVPLLILWIFYRLYEAKDGKLSFKIFLGFVASLSLAAFYILPVLFEAKFVNLTSTVQGYFDYRGHFSTLNQLFVSRFWGYGASVFGPQDGLSLSVGQLQWILPILTFAIILLKKKVNQYTDFLFFFILGFFFLFLTHNKSQFFWQAVPGMAYIQFPWRFLGMATFCFSLASGALIGLLNKHPGLIGGIIIVSSITLNFFFFKEDIWYKVGDSYFTTGKEWDRQRTASIGDYWPNFGHEIPDKPASGEFVNYFPGWVGAVPNKDGLIPSIGTVFTDTPIRKIGNMISVISFAGLVFVYTQKKWKEET